MPVTFFVLASAMATIAALFVVVPAVRSSRANGHSNWYAIGVFAVILMAGSATFYSLTSNWNWIPGGIPDAPVARQLYELQKTAHQNDTDPKVWAELGRFYLRFEQVPAAINAFETSIGLSRGQDVDTNLYLIEALAMRGDPNDQTRSAEIVSASLKISPDNRKALWYGGEIAASLGQWDVAIDRWQAVLNDSIRIDTDEARSVTRLLQQRIEAAKKERDNTATDSKEHHQGPPEAIRVRVSLNKDLAQTGGLTPSTPVFVFVRAQGQSGPPLAVHRATAGQLPLDITLSDANAMMPGRTISAFEQLEVVARVALGGAPTLTPGDVFGSLLLGSEDSRNVHVIINEVARAP